MCLYQICFKVLGPAPAVEDGSENLVSLTYKSLSSYLLTSPDSLAFLFK
jgi:hypothetical protein